MGGSTRRQNAVVVIVSAVLVAGSQGCATVDPVPTPTTPRFEVSALPGARKWTREAQGGGFVTVNMAATSGSLADWDGPPAVPNVYALIDNDSTKREKRYQLKKKDEVRYELELSNDGSGRTKWELIEVANFTLVRTRHRSGHLWRCHDEHLAAAREIGFRAADCTYPVEYDDGIAATEQSGFLARFASHLIPGDAADLIERAPIWISCNTGCCSLGR